MEVIEAKSLEPVRLFLDHYHPMRCGGALRGKFVAFWGIEPEVPGMSFLAVFVYPRSRWKRLSGMGLELSRLAWAPYARRSVSTFLRKCLRHLRRMGIEWVVTYSYPGTTGIAYARSGFVPFGFSSGAYRSRRGPNGRPTPDTIGSGVRLRRWLWIGKSGREEDLAIP